MTDALSHKRWPGFLLAIALGVFLILLLFPLFDIPAADVLSLFDAINPWLAALLFFALGLNIYISSMKWRIVTETALGDVWGFTWLDYFRYSALITVFTYIMPQAVSTLLIRSGIMKARAQVRVRDSSLPTVWDLAIDTLTAGCAAAISLLVLARLLPAWLHLPLWLAIALAMALFTSQSIGTAVLWLLNLAGRILPRFALSDQAQSRAERLLVSPTVSRRLFLLSIAKIFLLMLIPWLASNLSEAGIQFSDITVAAPLVMLSAIINITPAGLGTVEWTWVGLLVLQGYTAQSAALFALARRLWVLAAIIIWNIVLWFIRSRTGVRELSRRDG